VPIRSSGAWSLDPLPHARPEGLQVVEQRLDLRPENEMSRPRHEFEVHLDLGRVLVDAVEQLE
jgi:hypothetical protein